MSFLVGIDPSFRGTGIAIFDKVNSSIVKTQKISSEFSYSDIAQIHTAAISICNSVNEVLKGFKFEAICVEYPALATRSGAYLAILNGLLSATLYKYKVPVYWVPPIACDAYTGNKLHKKSFLVEWCKVKHLIDKRVTHDEATAIVFTQILNDVLSGNYTKSVFLYPIHTL